MKTKMVATTLGARRCPFALSVLLALTFCLMTSLAATVPALAAAHPARLVDNAGLLTEEEQATLLSQLDEISKRQQNDVVVATTDSLDGKTAMAYADDFYDEHGYGFGKSHDGVLLLVSMESRDWWMTTTGFCITAITDDGIDYISEQFLSDLSDGEYAEAFSTYASLCDEFITQAKTGDPYDGDHMPKGPFDNGLCLVAALIIGFLIARHITNTWKEELESVRPQPEARDYVRPGSLRVTREEDRYLRSETETIAKHADDDDDDGGSTTHFSSSGVEHGGGGGKF